MRDLSDFPDLILLIFQRNCPHKIHISKFKIHFTCDTIEKMCAAVFLMMLNTVYSLNEVIITKMV